MIFTDTHTHLYSEQFDLDRKEAIHKAIQAGVKRFFIPAIDSFYTQKIYALEQDFPKNVFLMAGLHPTHVKDNYEEELAHVRKNLEQRKFYAVGEIGIDLYWDKTHLKEQQIAFQTQIRWAKELGLPIAIHARESFDEIFEILKQEKSPELKGVFHCFTGTLKQAWQAIDYGMMLGIGGVVTFKNGKIDRFLHEIPLEHILLETDAPYLAPTPYRGKRNESAYIPLIAEKLATIYQKPIKEIAEITTENSKKLFGV
jgi:TatD DNase family protein